MLASAPRFVAALNDRFGDLCCGAKPRLRYTRWQLNDRNRPVVSIMLLERKGGEPTFAAMRTNGRYADDVAANSSSLVVSSSHHFD